MLYNSQKGMVVSIMNLTLRAVRSAAGSIEEVIKPCKFNDLIYEFKFVYPSVLPYAGEETAEKTDENDIQSQLISIIINITQKIANELKDPNQISQRDILAKYTLIARLVRSMSVSQLEQVTSTLFVQHNNNDTFRLLAWKAFRDAVATAGTGPALQIIQKWILSRKVQNEEAAELIAVLPKMARMPSLHYIQTFFVI